MNEIRRDFNKNKYLYLMIAPVLVFYITFHYLPMFGTIIAFQNFSPAKGFLGSEWVGFQNFINFFNSYYFFRILKNTIVISINSLIFGFPMPIILAILINEVRKKNYKRLVQTVTYLPHFISLVVICSLIKEFTADTGVINDIIALFGFKRVTMLQQPEWFVPVYIISEIWQRMGWESIIYLAALSGIDQQLYEASYVDGASKWRQFWYITLPGIVPTIVILLILRVGKMFSVGFEKIILLYNPLTYETADIISSFVFRKGLVDFAWSFSTAVELFSAMINIILLLSANWMAKKLSDNSLW